MRRRLAGRAVVVVAAALAGGCSRGGVPAHRRTLADSPSSPAAMVRPIDPPGARDSDAQPAGQGIDVAGLEEDARRTWSDPPAGKVPLGWTPPPAPDLRGPTGGENADFTRGEWLARHQSWDGAWRSEDAARLCSGPVCEDPGSRGEEVRATALALLVFLGYGETHKTPRCGAAVRKGLKYLRSVQDAEGVFGTRTSDHWFESHALATLALNEIYARTISPLFKASAHRGTEALLRLQQPDGGWRCGDGYASSEVPPTAWAAMALDAAKRGELIRRDEGALNRLLAFVESTVDPRTGRAGADRWPAVRRDSRGEAVPLPPRETAMATLVLLLGGRDAKSDPVARDGLGVLLGNLPRRDEPAGPVDPLYVHFGTLACKRTGGEAWRRWSDAMKRSVIDSQITDRDACSYGSWEPIPEPAADEGSFVVTALHILSLFEYYRWSKCFCDGRKPAEEKPGVEEDESP